jgi:hypothetical protein
VRLVAAIVVVALCAAARPARAEGGTADATREARHHFAEAETDYRAGRYADALAKYQAGYAAKPLPGFLINIAQCQRRLGDLKTARATYHEFILVAPDSRLVPEVQALIVELDAAIAELAAGQQPSEAEAAAGPEVHTTELVPPPVLAPAPPPETPPLIAAPAPATPEPTPPPPPRRSHARWWIWGGIAAAAIAGGIVAGVAMSPPGNTTIHTGTLGTLSR